MSHFVGRTALRILPALGDNVRVNTHPATLSLCPRELNNFTQKNTHVNKGSSELYIIYHI